jgi:hypothetical protein
MDRLQLARLSRASCHHSSEARDDRNPLEIELDNEIATTGDPGAGNHRQTTITVARDRKRGREAATPRLTSNQTTMGHIERDLL